jgi:hypothetical protein
MYWMIQGSISGWGKVFLFSKLSSLCLGTTQPPIPWILRIVSLGVKRPEREADESPPPSAEVKNEWSCTSVLPGLLLCQQAKLYLFMLIIFREKDKL